MKVKRFAALALALLATSMTLALAEETDAQPAAVPAAEEAAAPAETQGRTSASISSSAISFRINPSPSSGYQKASPVCDQGCILFHLTLWIPYHKTGGFTSLSRLLFGHIRIWYTIG